MKLRLPLLLVGLLLLLSSIKVNAQFIGCDPSVPNNPIDLSPSAFNGALYSPATYNSGIGYQCCGLSSTYSCETFTVTTHPNAIAMIIKVNANGANVVIKQTDCNTTITNNQFFCVTGGTTLQFSICSDENAPLNVQFETIGAPTVNSQTNATIGCTRPIQIQGYSEGTISLNSTNPGAIGDFNGLLNCNTGCGNQIQITPINGTPNSLTYQVCGASLAPSCIANGGNYCENITVNVYQPLSVSGLSNQLISICPGDPIPNITATVTGGLAPYTYFWNGPGLDQNLLLNDATISNLSAGSYSLEVYDATGCSSGVLSTTYNVIPAPTVNAGIDQSFCSPVNSILLQGNTTPQTNLLWSGGSGSFSNSTSPAAIYTPSPSEMVAGNITLTLTGSNACGNSVDNVVITFNTTSGLVINGSVSDVVCFGTTTGAIDITVTNGSGNYSYVWSNGMTTEDLTGLGSGIYSVQVNDLTYGCNNSIGFSVNNINPGPIFSVSSINVNPSCFGLNNGSISTSINGGASPYTYAWSNGNGTNPNLNNVGAGIYQLTVTDANGCTSSLTESLVSPQDITISASVTDVTCFGNQNGAIDVTVNGGSPPYLTNWQPGNQLTQDLFGLNGGAYTITITDQQGCSKNTTFTVNEPLVLSGSSITNNATCYGATNGSIDFTPTGGNPGYTYSWSNGATTQDISGIGNGTYTVTLIDANGCSVQIPFIITEPNQINLTISSSNATCFGISNGSASVTATGGDGNYTYLWSIINQTTSSVSNLSPNTYSITVTDGVGCSKNGTITISQPTSLAAVFSNTNIVCHGASTGAIDLTVSGGNGPYAQLWSNNATSEDLSGIPAGSYSVTITDANGCTAPFSTSLSEPAAITATSTNTNILCHGASTGAIDLNVSGGNGPYTQLWSNTATTEDLSGLSAGSYSVTITDANGCTAPFSTSLSEPAAITATSTNTNILCHGASTGAIDLTVSGGNGPYTQLWSNSTTTEDLSGLSAGSYSVTITDANGCTAPFSTSLSEPAAITATSTNTNILCHGASTGAINLTVSGGNGPYAQLWSNTATTEDLSGLSAGSYSVTITDANGCTAPFSTSLSEPAAITATSTNTNILCHGASTGAIDLTVSGGNGPYTQLWSNSATTEDLSGIPAGSYSVTITDANGCTSLFSTTISEPTVLQLSSSITHVSCFGNATGSINLSVAGGTGPYIYSWSNGSSTEDISNLNSGTYNITVTDNNNCTSQLTSNVNQPASGISITNTTTNVLCNGAATGSIDITIAGGTAPFNFLWNDNSNLEDISNLTAGNYNVTITDNNNCSSLFNFTINEPSFITISSVNSNILCNGASTGAIDLTVSGGISGYSFTWSNNATTEDLTGVNFGSYSVTVIDNNGCAANYNTSLSQPPQLTLTKNATNVDCFGSSTGNVDITVNGGVPNYTFSWNNGSSNEDLANVVAGTYTVNVTDANGCVVSTSATVNEPAALSLTTSSTSASCNPDGSASVTVTGGIAPYTYLWSNGGTNASITAIAAGNYTVNVTDANGCTANTTVTVAQLSGLSATAIVSAPILCNGGAATVDVSATGGTGPYSGTGQFSVSAGSYSYTVTDANGCSVNPSVVVTEPVLLTGSASLVNAILCNGGTADIDLVATGGTGPFNGTGPNNGLVAGTYSYNISDANGCTAVINTTITEPAPLTLTTVSSNALCNGSNDGGIDLTVSGGTSTYVFQWDNGSTNEDLTAVTAGNYNVIVTDANGCVASTSATVNEPAALSLTTSSTSASCNPDGSASVTVTGGIAPYTYLWSNSGTSASISAIAAGNYTVNVTDANGCNANTTVTVAQLSGLSATAIVSAPILCNGGAATVDVSATGGTGPYSGTGQFSVSAGSYSYTVTDANGCSVNPSVVVTEPVLLTGSASLVNAILCNGGTADINLVATGGTGPFNGTGPNNGLVAGTYSYNISDANGCTAVINTTITEPAPLTLTTVSSNALCNGSNDGGIDLTVSGGTSTYVFQWDNGSTNEDLTALTAGNYNVIVTDANGCVASTSATVNEPAALSLTTSSTSASCNPDGSASVTITGGTAPYTYAWSNGGNTASISAIAAGNYTVNVTDANGCSANTTVTVAQLSGLSATAIVSAPILCNGGAATVDVSATGGTGPYSGTGQFSVSAGSYSYTVTDANGCSVNPSVVVTEPVLLTGSASLVNAILCNGAAADIDLVAAGGTGPFNGTGPINGLVAGTYSYNISDANGCTAVINTTITEPAPLTLTTVSSNALCNGSNDGGIDLTVSGGTSTYVFQWDNGSTNEDLTALTAGNYNVIVTDANGCVASTSATVNEPAALSLTTSSTSASCNPDGSASVTITGGTAPYTYAWSNGGNTASITGVSAGNYTVTINDLNNCSAIAFVNVAQLSGLSATAIVSVPILCNGGAATVDVSATGGTGPYSGTGQFSVSAGSYSYTVTDANGCSDIATISINEPSILTISLTTTNISCNGFNDGIIQPNVSGGTPGYNYSWSNGSTNNSLSGLSANSYSLAITDLNGCVANSSATISEPSTLSLSSTITDALCNGDLNGSIDLTVTGGTVGYSFLWNNSSQTEDLSGISAGTYTVVVTDNNGCTASLVSNVNHPSTLAANSLVTTPITVNGGTGIITVSASGGTPSYTNTGTYTVSAGTYSYTVIDANGCSSITTVTITEPNQLIANAIISSPILCNGGNATVDVTAVGGQGPYTGTGTFILPAGTYNFTITDAFSVSATTSITITEPSALNTTGQGTNISCFGQNNGIASISANGGVGPYSFLWNNGTSNDSIINLAPGSYTVITTDANGCIQNDTIVITQPSALVATSLVSTGILCNGGNAVVSVTASGGIAPYIGTGNFTVSAGNHVYTITDLNGCSNTTSITVSEPSLLTFSTASTNVTCNGAANGTASITASGGVAPYTYLWSNNSTTSSITNLIPGTYTVDVTDANGCTVNTSITITEPTILTASSVITSPILCSGGNAVISISATGGTSPYTGIGNFNAQAGTQSYTVTDANGCIAQTNIIVNQPGVLIASSVVSQSIQCYGGTGQITISAIGGTLPYVGTGVQTVLTGTYNYTVTDANGCTGLTSISISQPTQLTINIVGTNPLCNGNSNGSAQATVSGGTSPYAYSWSNGSSTSTATNLTSGTYTVQVTDANGCIVSGSVTLTQPATLSANATISSAILCNGGTGQVLVSANGGTSPYSGIGQFSALAGNATYTVTDLNGCTASVSINVSQPSALIVNSAITSPIACFGGNGNIIVTATGGTPSYTGTGTYNVSAGTYTYPVTDANGCSTTTTLTINQPTALVANAVVSNPILCNGGSASILVSAIGGTLNYSGTGSFTAIAGVQTYTVIDANGCASTASVNVVQPTQLSSSISSQNVTCNGLNNGSAIVTPLGGTPNYSYVWSNGATTASVSNLAPGAYSVTVTDANGCQSISNVIISQPTALTSSVIQTASVLCFGSTGTVFVSANGGTAPYSGLGSFTVNAGNQVYTITDANGCTSTSSILITQPTQLIATATQTTPILCFGGQSTVAVTGTGGTGAYTGTGSFSSVAGNITYTIQDANGCTSTTTILISQPTSVTGTFNNTSVTCFGLSNGSSIANVSGGTPGYTYLWNTGSNTNFINNQLAGNYVLQVTDANGCIFNLNTTITQPAPIVATANVILPIACFGGQAIVLVNGAGGTPGYSGNGTFNEFAGIHTYVLTDQNGCIDSTTINVTQPAAFTASATITSPIACNGGQATVVVTGTGGTAPYTGTGTFIVTPGTYTYTLIDANGCSATTTITVTQPAVLAASATIISPILCNGGTAQVQVSAIGGSLPYSGTGIFTVVSGTYNYLVTDANGCNANTSISVPQPTLLVTNVVPTNITCFGANNGSAIVFNSGGVAPLSILWSNGSTSNSIAGLSPGNYSVTVTDANGCQNVNPFIITQPSSLTASANQISPILCYNGNATVTVSATGGTTPYTGIGTFFPIAGSYNYIVTDAQGCVDTAAIIVTQPTALAVTATIVSPIACFGGQATVNIAANGGVAPYTGIGNFNVSSGNQSFTVTDANGCAFVVSLFVPQPTPLISPISAQNVSCFNAGNGSATANPNGGTPGYQYTWSTGGSGQTINNLIPGLYTVTVTDANGCQTTNQITITQPTMLSINATLSAPVFCFGGNAVVSVSSSGGTPTYTGTGNFNQAAGTTTYYVTDANGCVDSIAFTVVQPAQLIASVIQTSNVLCFGGTATVLVSATGGTPSISGIGNFTVSAGWNSYTVTDNYGCQDTTSIFITQPTQLVANATQTSAILCNGGNAVINVSASGGTPGYIGQGNFTVISGTYTYTVSDTNGCTANTTISISQPNPLQAIATVTSPVVCNAGTGVITITGNGGTAPYTGTGSFTGIAGTYTYAIVDANGCTSSVTITLTQPPVLTVSLTQTNVNCNGFATGSITANPVGGQGPYTYLWSNNQVTQTVANLLAGSYSVQVTDNLGCTVNGSAIITQPLAPILLQESHTNILCFGNNTGSIDLSVSGGTSPYTYSWSNSATTQDLQNLIAGTYIVTVTDANGCIATLSIPVTQPAIPLTVGYTTTNVSCFGLSDGSIDVTPLGGTGPFTYYWTTGLASQDLSNLPAGQYIVAITDANNCVTSAQITINQPTAPLSGTITQLPITCYGADDGQLTANANGGTPPYSYTWSPSGQTGSIATMLAPGTYVVSIVDANGCTAAATDVLATPPSLIAQMNISDNIVCLPSIATVTNASVGTFNNVLWTLSDGQSFTSNQFTLNLTSVGCIDITLLITNANGCTADTTISDAICVIPGPTAAFSTTNPEIDFSTGELSFVNNSINYIGSIWQFGDGTSATLDNPIHTYPAATIDSYNVMLVVYDANGCTDTAYSVVESNDLVRLTVPNGFTPNGDGLNDIFLPVVSNADQIKFYRFEVYNRWGQLVFESTKPGEGWDGKFNGKQAQFGVYSWSVRFEVPENDPVSASGHVTLIK